MCYQNRWTTHLWVVGLLLGSQLICGGRLQAEKPLAKVAKEESLQRYTFEKGLMGVPFRIVLYAKDEATANKAAQSAYKRVNELNAIMSDYDPKSELMLLCKRSKKGHPVKISGDLMIVLHSAKYLCCKTDGAFDVTVGPMVKAWRRARQQRRMPSKRKIEQLKQRVGSQFWALTITAPQTVELKAEKMQLDLGGIAKGYAADEAIRVLKKQGITRLLVDAGGDIVAGDPPPGKKGWKIGIAALNKPNAPPSRFVLLANKAIATSGDAYQYYQFNGKRYSHIVNPHTGIGLTTRSSVSVIAPTGIQADSLASAVSVLGPKRGLKLIESAKETSVLILTIEDDKLQEYSSKGFEEIGRE